METNTNIYIVNNFVNNRHSADAYNTLIAAYTDYDKAKTALDEIIREENPDATDEWIEDHYCGGKECWICNEDGFYNEYCIIEVPLE